MIGFVLTGPDNSSWMYRSDLNPPVCEVCGLLRDRNWINPTFALVDSGHDLTYTYDGAAVVSSRLAELMAEVPGAQLTALPSEPGFFLLVAGQIVEFDVEARQTKQFDPCPVCGRYHSVAGAIPVMLKYSIPLPSGISRTDLEFGTGLEQHPLLLVDPDLGERLEHARLRGVELLAVK